MNGHDEVADLGRGFANESVEYVTQRAEAYCECERERIELTNESRINELQLAGRYLVKRERDLEARLQRAVPVSEQQSRRRKARYYWATGILLIVAAFFFSLIAFEPYRLGIIGDLYCLGIAVVAPFAVEEFLEAWKSEKVFRGIVTAVFCAALIGGAMLAAIRGDLLAEQVQPSAPAVSVDGETTSAQQPQNTFYDSTRSSLRLLMLFLAFAIDLGAGVAIHRALVCGAISGEDAEMLLRELGEVQQRLVAIVYEITALTNAPAIFVTQFWRDFYRALLTGAVRRAMTKLLGLSFCLLLIGKCWSAPQSLPDVVVAVDLSASEAVKGHDGKSQFSKNIEGVGRLLAAAPAGSEIKVVGITENSFGQPYVLLSASVSSDQGYFGERLSAARAGLVSAWARRTASLSPNARGTDITGALLLASELFNQGRVGASKILFLYSDMRQVTPGLNLETRSVIRSGSYLAIAKRLRLVARLRDVTVYVLGADAAGKSFAAWDGIRQFWKMYFELSGARLAGYSALSEPPEFQQERVWKLRQ